MHAHFHSMCFLKKTVLFIAFLLLFTETVFSQTLTQTIRGTVVDKDSKQPLTGATIIALETNPLIGNISDEQGKFKLAEVPLGRYTIKCSCLGYEDVVLSNIVLTSGKEMVLTLEMQEKIIQGESVTVFSNRDRDKTNNDLISISGRNFQPEETWRYAGTRADPSRMAANYAGVVSANDTRNDIIVRGNSPSGVLWKLEGVEIPNPNHFSGQGATGGPMSMLNNNLLASSDFLTGAFPAEYGNKTAAVFDLKLRRGNNEHHEFTGMFGINGLELGAEGPFSKNHKSSYLISYRYSTFALFNLLGINFGVSGIPTYQDATFLLNFPISKKDIVSIFGIGGMSKISLLDSKRDSSDWQFVAKGEDIVYGTKMAAGGISYTHFFNTNTYSKLTLSSGTALLHVMVDTLGIDNKKSQTYDNNSTDGNATIEYFISKKFNEKNLLKTGANYSYLFFNYHEQSYRPTEHSMIDLIKNNGNTGMVQAYTHWQHRFSDKIVLNTGIHFEDFLLNGSYSIEPRIGFNYKIGERNQVSFGYGMHSQTMPLMVYFFELYDTATHAYTTSNLNLGLMKSHHLIAGYDFNFIKNFRLKTEVYYQYLYDVPIKGNDSSSYSAINMGGDYGFPNVDSLVNKGTGYNYGAEFTLEKFFSNHYYFLVTTSLFESKYTGSDLVLRDTKFNGHYVLNTLVGYEFKYGKNKNQALSLDLKYTLAGGRRYTPIDLAASQFFNNEILIDSKAWNKQLPDYWRFDVKIGFRINTKHATHSIIAVCENVFGTKNILQQTYNTGIKNILTEYQLGVFPYGAYRVEF